jgi:hypothetical protein
LVGQKAVHAGSDDLRAKVRVFGVAMETLTSGEARADPVDESLRRCGSKSTLTLRGFRIANDAPTATNTAIQFKNAGVTSIFCMCESVATMTAAMTTQTYFPEFLTSTLAYSDTAQKIKSWTPEQRDQVFGVSYTPRETSVEKDPSRWAEIEGGGTPSATGNSTLRDFVHWYYRNLLLLASGI